MRSFLWLYHKFLVDLCDLFTHILEGRFTGAGPIVCFRWPWSMWKKSARKSLQKHDDVIKRKHFPRYWPFVRGIQRSPVNSPHNGQWRGALMFSLICARINAWVNNREVDDLRRHRPHYNVIVMKFNKVLSMYLCLMYYINQHCVGLCKTFDEPQKENMQNKQR